MNNTKEDTSLRVLLVEDNPVNQEVAAAMLRKRGHEVHIVVNGRLALDALSDQAFDVVLMDVQMPEMDGLAATREIRKNPKHVDLPIIGLTAHADRAQCLEAGMNDHVGKPFKPETLYQAVERVSKAAPSAETGAGGSEEEESPPVDLEGFRQNLREAGVEEAIDSIIGVFVNDAPSRMESLEAAVAGGDASEIDQAAHAFKSAALTVHAHRLGQTLKELEFAGKDGNVELATDLIDRARADYQAALSHIKTEMPELGGDS